MNLLYLTVLFPLIGFLLLAFSRGRWSENLSAAIGMGSVGLAALTTLYVGMDFFSQGQGFMTRRCGPGCRLATLRLTLT